MVTTNLEPGTTEAAEGRDFPQLADYVSLLRLRTWSILLVTAAVFGAWLAWSASRAPVYTARAEVLVKAVVTTTAKPELSMLNMATERKVARSLSVASVAAGKLEVEDPEQLLDALQVDVEGETTPVLDLTYTSGDPAEALRSVQALAEGYLEHRREQIVNDLASASRVLEQQLRVNRQRLSVVNDRIAATADEGGKQLLLGEAKTLTGQIGVLEQELAGSTPPDDLRVGEILRPASIASVPVQRIREGVMVLLLAVAVGFTQALAREFLGGRVRKPAEFEAQLGAPVLGSVPRPKGLRIRRREPALVMRSVEDGGAAGAFRRLKVALLLAIESSGAKTITLTDVEDDEGRTFVAANLSFALAGPDRPVILVSTQDGNRTVGRLLSAGGDRGLADVLMGEARIDEVLERTSVENLSVLPAGCRPDSCAPADLLASAEMAKVLCELRQMASLVLLDAGAALDSADCAALAPIVDGVLIVVNARGTPRATLREVRDQLSRVNARMVGIVVNGV